MVAFDCPRTTAAYCACACHNCSGSTGSKVILIYSRAAVTMTPLDKKLHEFQRDMERAMLRAENKENFITWSGTKNGRPFHLRKWYR